MHYIYKKLKDEKDKESYISLHRSDEVSSSMIDFFFVKALECIIKKNKIDNVSISRWNANPLIMTKMEIIELVRYLSDEVNALLREEDYKTFLFVDNDYSELVDDFKKIIKDSWT